MNTLQKILKTLIVEHKEFNDYANSDTYLQQNVDLFKKELDSLMPSMLKQKREDSSVFIEHNFEHWKNEFNVLETIILLSIEIGEEFYHTYRSKALKDKNAVFVAIIKNHAKACHIAQDMLVLLKSGYADAAYARWRALHEVNVIANFIQKNGQECAERFFDYEDIKNYKSATLYQEHEKRLKGKGPTEEQLNALKNNYDELFQKYGKSFKNQYGWACKFIYSEEKCQNNRQKVTFLEIEKNVKLDHLRPCYNWASQYTHASTEGLNPALGLSEAKEKFLLVGQSNSGMGLPMSSLVMSLVQATSLFLLMEKTKSLHIIMKSLSELKNDLDEMIALKS